MSSGTLTAISHSCSTRRSSAKQHACTIPQCAQASACVCHRHHQLGPYGVKKFLARTFNTLLRTEWGLVSGSQRPHRHTQSFGAFGDSCWQVRGERHICGSTSHTLVARLAAMSALGGSQMAPRLQQIGGG